MKETFIIILIIEIIVVYFLTAINKLAYLQQKDYLRKRIFADKKLLKLTLIDNWLLLIVIFELLRLLTGQFEVILLIIESIVLVIVIFNYLLQVIKKRFKKPRFTIRIMLNLVLVLTPLLLSVFLAHNYILLATILTLLSLYLIILSNELTKRVIFIGHRISMAKAKNSLIPLSELKTIGITGSYGKSTTKLFLHTLLVDKFPVLTTPGSINTDIGIAVYVNSQLKKLSAEKRSYIKYLILEMDAYFISTIKRITKYFPLDIAIITGINEQHLETFSGDISQTIEANYMIFKGFKLMSDKIAIFNFSNEYCKELAKRFTAEFNKKYYSYGVSDTGEYDANISQLVNIVKPGKNILRFKLNFSRNILSSAIAIELPILGDFNAVNFAGAALVAKLCGLSDSEIKKNASEITINNKTLKLSLTQSKIEFIDDSFNSNPSSIDADIKLLMERNRVIPTKNILVFPGLVDLNKSSKEIHAKIGQRFANAADSIIITDDNWGNETVSEINDASKSKFFISSNISLLIAKFKTEYEKLISTGDEVNLRILICGRIPSELYKFIINHADAKF